MEDRYGRYLLNQQMTALNNKVNAVSNRSKKATTFYSAPAGVNGLWTISGAVQYFSFYDLVIFGDMIQAPTDPNYATTKQVCAGYIQERPDGAIAGYVDLGVTTQNNNTQTLQQRINWWKQLGAKYIFLDDAGYDFHTSRDRLNTTLDYIHSLGLGAIVNAWNALDVMAPNVDATYNPGGVPSHMGTNDIFYAESFVVDTDAYNTTTPAGWEVNSDITTRGSQINQYKNSLGCSAMASGVIHYTNFNTAQILNYWNIFEAVSLLYGFEFYGVADTSYASGTAVVKLLPYSNSRGYYDVNATVNIDGTNTQFNRAKGGMAINLTYDASKTPVTATRQDIQPGQTVNFGQSLSDIKLTTTAITAIADVQPYAAGNWLVNVYYRVITAATNVTITLTYNDGTGAQTITLLALTSKAVGSYTIPVTFINAAAGADIKVNVTAGTANQVFASASVQPA